MSGHPSLAILMWSADLSAPERLATPFVMAQAALALDATVELYFTAHSVQLLTPAAGATPIGFGAEQLALGAYLAQSHAAGVRMYACSQALHAAGLRREDLIPACQGLGGSVQFMDRSLDPAWRTLVF